MSERPVAVSSQKLNNQAVAGVAASVGSDDGAVWRAQQVTSYDRLFAVPADSRPVGSNLMILQSIKCVSPEISPTARVLD